MSLRRSASAAKESSTGPGRPEGSARRASRERFPKTHRTRIRSSRPLARPNGEIRRRIDVVRTFPNEASIYRLVGVLLHEQDDGWAPQRRHMTMEMPTEVEDNPNVSLPVILPDRRR